MLGVNKLVKLNHNNIHSKKDHKPTIAIYRKKTETEIVKSFSQDDELESFSFP